MSRSRSAPLASAFALSLLAAVPVAALVAPSTDREAGPTPARIRTLSEDAGLNAAWAATDPAWAAFREAAGGIWSVRVDARTLRPAVAAGSGWPLLPGAGNELSPADVGLTSLAALDLPAVERVVRERFLEPHAGLFRVDPAELQLDPRSSGRLRNGRVWSLDFQHVPDGIPVEGASIGLRINSGNLVVFGTVLLADVDSSRPPRLDAEEALGLARAALGGRSATGPIDLLEAGTLLRYPLVDDSSLSHRTAWRLRFSVPDEIPTWEARIDAVTGEVLTLHDANDYQCEPRESTAAQVVGGVLALQPSDTEVLRPLPFATVTENGVGRVADWNGGYAYSGGVASTSLAGRYFSMTCVTCTNPSRAFVQDAASGRLDLGLGGNNDDGNGFSTRAERTTFYQANLVRHVAAKWYGPGEVPWLEQTVPARVNLDSSCNAFWNGVGINFFHAGGGCGNTGEVAGVIQHEWGHGMDQATGRAGDGARGEGVGDVMDLMISHEAEIGPGFRNGGQGVRCVDWRTCNQAPGPLGTPLTAGNVASYCPAGGGSPLGRQVHCEGQIYAQTSWDLSVELVAKYGQWGGWHVHESIFFPALLPSDTYLPNDVGGAFWSYVSIDDDDGDLTNGTPNASEIFAAFDLHEIAPSDCASDPACPTVSSAACTPPASTIASATPILSPIDGSVSVELAWAADPAVDHWVIYRTDLEEDDGYFRVAEAITETSFIDPTVTNGLAYWYVVQPVDASGCSQPVGTPVQADISLPELTVETVTSSDLVGGDGDGVVEPGETIGIRVVVGNAGATPATSVTGTLSSGNPALAIVSVGATTWPDVPAGETRSPDSEFEVQIPAGRWDCGDRVVMSVLLESDDGCFTSTFALEIGSGLASVSIADFEINDTALTGNANGRAEPGETFELSLDLFNAGPADLNDADLLLRSLDPRLTLLSDTSTLASLPAAGSARIDLPFQVALDPAADCPGSFEVELSIVGAEGCWTDRVQIPIGATRVLFAESFETDQGWTYGGPFETSNLGTWTRGIPNGVFDGGRPWQPGAAAAGLACALTGNETVAGNPEHGDLDFETTLFSPPIDLSGETEASLSYAWWLAKAQAADELELSARVDGGAWQSLRLHDADSPAWSTELVDLALELGSPLGLVELRFRASSESASGGLMEAAIDDLLISHVDCDEPLPTPGLALAGLRFDEGSGPDGHGNGDGAIDAGESIAFIPELTNLRNADAVAIRLALRLVAGPAGLQQLAVETTTADLAPGASAETDAPHFRLLVPETATCGDELVFELATDYEDLAGNPYFTRLGLFSFPIGSWTPAPCDPFQSPGCAEPIVRIGPFHDFEGGSDRGWAHGILRDELVLPGNSDDWQRKAPVELAADPAAAYSGTSVFGTDLRAGPTDSSYQASTHTFLESPTWDASRYSAVHLRYARWLSVQGSDFDEAVIEVNGSEVWRNDPQGPLVDPACVDPFGADSTYLSDAEDMPEGPAGWKLIELDVSALADHQEQVSARWRLRTDRQCELGGWNLDAVELIGVADRIACNAFDPCTTPMLVDAGPPGTLTCEARRATLQGSIVASDGSFGHEIAWSPAAGVSDPGALVTEALQPGTYTLTVRDLATGCVGSAEVLIDETVAPPTLVGSGDGPITCTNADTLIRVDVSSGDGSLGYEYSWTPAGPLSDPSAAETSASAAGNYICTVTDLATGCQASTIVSVSSDKREPRAEAGPVRVSVCFGTVTLAGRAFGGNGSQGYSYSWDPPGDLDDPSSATPSTDVPGRYELTVTDNANGCTGTDSVFVVDAGDRDPPAPTGNALRVLKEGFDVVLDLSPYPAIGGETFDLYRSLRTDVLEDATLDRTSPYLWILGEAGPQLRDAGAFESGGEPLVCYRVHVRSGCGLESP